MRSGSPRSSFCERFIASGRWTVLGFDALQFGKIRQVASVSLLPGMHAIKREQIRDVHDLCARLRHAHPKLVVKAIIKIVLDARAGGFPDAATPKDFGLVKEIALEPAVFQVEQLRERQGDNLAKRQRGVMNAREAAGFEEAAAAHHDVGFWKEIKGARDMHEGIGSVLVIAVEPSHDFAGDASEAFVDSVGLAIVLLAAGVSQPRAITVEDGARLVGRATIQNEVFETGIILAQDGLKSIGDKASLVEAGRDDRNLRPGIAARQGGGEALTRSFPGRKERQIGVARIQPLSRRGCVERKVGALFVGADCRCDVFAVEQNSLVRPKTAFERRPEGTGIIAMNDDELLVRKGWWSF